MLPGSRKTLAQKIPKVILSKQEYYWQALEIFESQEWRCDKCGRIKPLQLHHKTKRSHGRDDSKENLCGLCSDCHRKADEYYDKVRIGAKSHDFNR